MLGRSLALLRRGGGIVRRIPGVDTVVQSAAYLRCRTRLRGMVQEDTVMLCVYRAANRRAVGTLVAESEAAGIASHLWALDSEVAELSRWTRGVGPGMRMELLNRLWEHGARSKPRQVVVCDDDFVFATGGVRELVLAAEYCGFGIAQASHAGRSFISHAFTRS